MSVLDLRSAELLYRFLFWVIGLTFLPTGEARALPFHLRAIKRFGWKYLIPRINQIKARFPRLIMPTGFIDRSLVQAGTSCRYQPVNLMDLLRWRNIFGYDDPALIKGIFFTQNSGIRKRWKEAPGVEDDSFGFWSEALYHLCLRDQNFMYRSWLAESILDLEDNELGIPPSLLGSNVEAIPGTEQIPCPSPSDSHLRIINLSHHGTIEFLIINPTTSSLKLGWDKPPSDVLVWKILTGGSLQPINSPIKVPARGCLWSTSDMDTFQ